MFSVIIPTKNRIFKLANCLNALEKCNDQGIYEIIVVDDHSEQGNREEVTKHLQKSTFRTHFIENRGTGPAAARNTGIRKASSPIILFLGDDMLATPDLIKKHHEFHRMNAEPEKVLVGKITWKPELKITPLMNWLENGGPQFGFPDCTIQTPSDYRFFFSSNASIKKILLEEKGMFDEEFPFASFEDTELAYRLHKLGMLSLYYEPSAVCHHDHPMTFIQCRKRMVRVGYSAKLLVGKHPELQSLFIFMEDILRTRYKNFLRGLCFPVGYLFRSKRIVHPFFWQVMARYFMIGYHGDLNDVLS